MQKKQTFNKSSLQKALKDRLALLTGGLGEAEMGGKGIELVKEMKELHTMLENILGEEKASKAQDSKKDSQMHITFSWGKSEEE